MAAKKKAPASNIRTPSRRRDSAKPLTAEQARKIDEAGRKRERAGDVEVPTEGRGIVAMKGRLLADGTRRGAAVKRRTTLYLPLAVADELDERARRGRVSLSDAAAEALAESWAIDLESAS